MNHRLKYGSGNVAHEAARIKAKHPEIAAAVERGEYPSMRAAARAAGIKLREYLQISKNDPQRAATTIRKHYAARCTRYAKRFRIAGLPR